MTEPPRTARGRRLSRREFAVWRRCDQWGVPYSRVSRGRVFKRDGWICQLCKEPVDRKLRFPKPGSASLDHVHPLSVPGSPGHVYTNCQLAHLRCNQSKGKRLGLAGAEIDADGLEEPS